MPNQYPVVPAWVWVSDDGKGNTNFRLPSDKPTPNDLPALAVPLALFEDAEFHAAVHQRLVVMGRKYKHANEPVQPHRFTFHAIAAELRARAGGEG